MSDDEIVPMTALGDDGEPAPEPPEPESPSLPWTTVATALAAIVAAFALCVVAWAEVGHRRAAERDACLQEVQLRAFGLQGGDPRQALRDELERCGVEVPETTTD